MTDGRGANKGVFITSSHFTPDAEEWIGGLSRNVALIDGERLAELMVRSGVGVTTLDTFATHAIDEDFFIEELG